MEVIRIKKTIREGNRSVYDNNTLSSYMKVSKIKIMEEKRKHFQSKCPFKKRKE